MWTQRGVIITLLSKAVDVKNIQAVSTQFRLNSASAYRLRVYNRILSFYINSLLDVNIVTVIRKNTRDGVSLFMPNMFDWSYNYSMFRLNTKVGMSCEYVGDMLVSCEMCDRIEFIRRFMDGSTMQYRANNSDREKIIILDYPDKHYVQSTYKIDRDYQKILQRLRANQQ